MAKDDYDIAGGTVLSVLEVNAARLAFHLMEHGAVHFRLSTNGGKSNQAWVITNALICPGDKEKMIFAGMHLGPLAAFGATESMSESAVRSNIGYCFTGKHADLDRVPITELMTLMVPYLQGAKVSPEQDEPFKLKLPEGV